MGDTPKPPAGERPCTPSLLGTEHYGDTPIPRQGDPCTPFPTRRMEGFWGHPQTPGRGAPLHSLFMRKIGLWGTPMPRQGSAPGTPCPNRCPDPALGNYECTSIYLLAIRNS